MANARDRRCLYLGAAFGVDPSAATSALIAKLDTLKCRRPDGTCRAVLAACVRRQIASPRSFSPDNLPFDTLERLVWIAFRTIRVEEDRDRTGSGGYTPDERDHAEEARGCCFQSTRRKHQAEPPSMPCFASRSIPTVRSLLPGCEAIARHRAAEDSESAPWPPAEPFAFERSYETAPHTARDLQRVALRRLADIQHELLHGDFAQGATLSALPDEPAVQNWVADRLRLKQGRAYSIEREPHVVGEKEPDVRFRAKATDASVAMEIKVTESWTLPDLEAALTDQLCGRYLRAKDARYGILLLVHQKARTKGMGGSRDRCVSLASIRWSMHLKAASGADRGRTGCPAARNRRPRCLQFRRGAEGRKGSASSGSSAKPSPREDMRDAGLLPDAQPTPPPAGPRDNGDLSRFMRWLTMSHTQRWHAHYRTAGTGHFDKVGSSHSPCKPRTIS